MKLNKPLLFILLLSSSLILNAQDLSPKSFKTNYNKGINYLEQDSVALAWPYLRDAYYVAETHYKPKSKFGKSLMAFYKASILNKKFSVIDSLNLTDELVASSKRLKGNRRLENSRILEVYADSLLTKAQIKNAIKFYSERKFILEENDITTTDSEIFAKLLYAQGKNYKDTKDGNSKAQKDLELALAIVESNGPSKMINEEDILMALIPRYIALKDDDKTDKAISEILSIIKSGHGDMSIEYGQKLHELGVLYYNYKLYEKSSEYVMDAIRIFEAIGHTDFEDYLIAYYFLGLIEESTNNYTNAIKAYKKVQQSFINMDSTNHDIYARVLGRISLNYDKSGDFENALKYCEKALNIDGISDETKSIRLMDKAYFYQNMGQYKKSHLVYDEAMKFMQMAIGIHEPEYAKLLNNIGKLYFIENELVQALKYFKDALEIVKVSEEEKWHDFYSYFLNDYAKALLQLGEKNKAIKLMEKNLAYWDNADDLPKKEEYYNRKSSLAKAYNLTDNYHKALPLIEEATTKLKEILGEDHVDYGGFLDILSNTYFGLGDIDKAVSVLERSNAVFVNQIDKIFRFSSEREKKEFLQMITLNFNHMQSIALTKNIDNANLNSINLNNQLMLKGLLLNNSKDILLKLKNLQEPTIDIKIRDYKNLKNKRTRALTEYSVESKLLADSLSTILNTKEAELVKLYMSNFEHSMSLVRDWKSIQNQIRDKDVVIEFSHFEVLKDKKATGQIEYVAYLFTANDSSPKMIKLFEESQLNLKSEKFLYNDDELYKLIWKPLEPYINKDGNVYYAPSGLLNQISFAAISKNGKPLILNHNLIQLSSTYKLTEKELSIDTYSSLLVGGVKYDYDLKGKDKITEAGNENISFLNNSAVAKRRGTKSRGESWSYLKGTLEEIENLNMVLGKKGAKVRLLKAHKATESEFKSLSGKSPSIIHIATHGFFFEDINRDASIETNLSREDQYRLAEDPLLRSGLILAGANYIWKNGHNPYEAEDGILTAMEISNLDLSNTHLVVLSACKTGLGDIDGSEGVYGLQRAFKMAGVDRLIMSLWEVPDQETALFMRTFYNQWLSGNSMRNAFAATQRQLYTKFPKEPYKWAAFVLFE